MKKESISPQNLRIYDGIQQVGIEVTDGLKVSKEMTLEY